MAVGFQNYPDIEPADSDFPAGSLKDDTGIDDGTPVNRFVYNDMHMTFFKMLSICSIAPTGNFDNEYNGYQYIRALMFLSRGFGQTVGIDGAAASTIVDGRYDTAVVVLPDAATGHLVSLDVVSSGFTNRVRIANYSAFTVQIQSVQAYNINGNPPPFNLGSMTFIELLWNSGTTDWDLVSQFVLPDLP